MPSNRPALPCRPAARAVLCIALVGAVLATSSCLPDAVAPDGRDRAATTPVTLPSVHVLGDPVIAAAGDLVCGSSTPAGNPCQHGAVASLIPSLAPDAVLLLGDIQYESGSLSDFRTRFDPAFGAYRSLLYPVPGNHEYKTSGAAGYFDYFNGVGVTTGRAGTRGQGYYSFNLGTWHIVVLNSNCARIGDCGAGSAMEQWLRADLAANPAMCTLAAWHHPRFSSGNHGSIAKMQAIWQALYDLDADVVLSGHDHDYERFSPQTATGAADANRGIRQFVVGTGGKEHGFFRSPVAHSEVRDTTSFGLLTLTLHPTSYDWRFVPIAGHTLNDAGTTNCHGAGAPPPPPPTTITALASADAYIVRASSTTNRGTLTKVVVDSMPVSRTFLRFVVSGIGNRTVTSVKLRLWALETSNLGGRVHRLADQSWGETTLTWANAPAYDSAVLGTFGSIIGSGWQELDVTGVISGDGTYSLVLDSPSTDAISYASREVGTAQAPRLVITAQ